MISKKLLAVITASTAFTAMADVKPMQLFTDNMVIQRETKAPVWGWADAGEKVVVSGSWGESVGTTASADGKWMVKLQTPEAGGPYTITLKGNNTITLKNVLSGDVWLCSGQSNMAMQVAICINPEEESKNANYPNIRHFTVKRKATRTPADNCEGNWLVCSPDTVKGFSATAYYTGRELHKNLNIPIGLLTSAWGGTCVEAWIKLSEQADDPFAQKRKEGLNNQAKTYNPEKEKERFAKQMAEWKAKVKKARAAKKGAPRRPRLQIDPHKNQNYPSNLYNGMINPLLGFAVKGAIWYQGEANSQTTEAAEHYRVQLDRMIRTWRTAWGMDFPFYPVQLPNFKAAQTEVVEHKHTWPVIRESFTYVAQNTPNCATATMIDIGEARDIHPKNKQGVGFRMASTILNKTYGKETPTTPFVKSSKIEGDSVVISFEYTGSGLMAKNGELKTFAIAGADKNFVEAEAKIEKRGNKDVVVVRSDKVKEPASVRYAWANNPEECNLFSKEGFPASPFRTDNWDLNVK